MVESLSGNRFDDNIINIDVRFTCAVDKALCCAGLRGRSSGSNEH